MAVSVGYFVFLIVAFVCFWRVPLRVAILVVLVGGWLLLPVAHFPPGALSGGFTWRIVGIALPSDMLLTKAWIAPLTALIGATARDFETVKAWRPSAMDLPMAAWCMWPLADGMLVSEPDPSPIIAAAYVSYCWGVPWLIGRIWFSDEAGGLILTKGLAFGGLSCLPIALVEGVRPAWLYHAVYGQHPFQSDGAGRYVGFRPLGFFENGNLYGLWTSLCALAAVWLALRYKRAGHGWIWIFVAVLTLLIAVASQSVGAIMLLLVGLLVMLTWRFAFVPALLAVAAGGVLVLGTVHLSGLIPLQTLAREPAGQQVIGALRSLGRESFAWRVSQDTKVLSAIAETPVTGTARWDWWRPYGTRPWGQAMLLVGQYGLIGLALAWGSLLAAAGAGLMGTRNSADRGRPGPALPLGLIILLALGDALLNAFFFSPAIVAAGAVAVRASAPAVVPVRKPPWLA